MVHRAAVRSALEWAGKWSAAIILFLLVLSTVMTVVAASGYTKARDAQRRVNVVEFERAAEQKAADIDQVSTCFRTSEVRPQVVEIFEALANQQEFTAKTAIRRLINDYNKTTPTRRRCLALAIELGIDPAPYEGEQR